MRLAEDRRARVPFALVGIVLLVGSAAVSASLAGREPATEPLHVDTAVERATASSQTALRSAVRRASRDAARHPVTNATNTTYGRVLNESSPFRDALRIRIYLAARTALQSLESRSGDVHARLSLPTPSNASSLRRAKQRVHLTRGVGNGTGTDERVRVRVEGIQLTVAREGDRVERTTRNASVVVSTPVLAMHERVSAFEERLDRGPLDGGPGYGLGARLTAGLYPLAWARGYAQYGGAPIQNVVANRHVEYLANGAVLDTQRAVFDRSDPAGRAAVRRAGQHVAVTDLLAGTRLEGRRWVDLLLEETEPGPGEAPEYTSRLPTGEPAVEEPVTVGVNRSADVAFVGFVGGQARGDSLDDVLDSVYSAETELRVSVDRVASEPKPTAGLPGGWTLVNETEERTRRVTRVSAPEPSVNPHQKVFTSHARRVVDSRSAVQYWRRGNRTRRVELRWQETHRVDLAVVGTAAATAHAPARPIATAFERGGPLDGPNLMGVPEAAVERHVTARGGPDGLARAAVDGALVTRQRTIDGRRPPALRGWVYADLAALRDQVRNVSVAVERGAVGSQRENPPAALAAELRDRRQSLVDAPQRYGSVASKARVAARSAYLDRVVARLDARAERTRTTRSGIDDALADANGPSLDRLGRILDGRNEPRPAERPEDGSSDVSVDGEPSYLTLERVDRERVSAVPSGGYHPLAARNSNLFTLPYGDAADTVTERLLGGEQERVRLRVAARTLHAANRTVSGTDNETLRRERDVLQTRLSESMDRVRERTRNELEESGLRLSRAERRAAINAGLANWETTAARALAVSNGSAATVIADEAVARYPNLPSHRRDLVRLRVRLAVESAARGATVRVPEGAVNETATTTRDITKRLAGELVEEGVRTAGQALQRRAFNETRGTISAGLPVAPIPGYWYATMNVWDVAVRGSYARFTVRVDRGTPATPGASIAYSRSRGDVSLDVDDDGERERIGRTTRVSFETRTAVVVVVPPNGNGVGDIDGDADERSPGWDDE